MQPYYTADNVKSAYRLRYAWTGWPSNNSLPGEPNSEFFSTLAESWESDGIRLLEHKWHQDSLKILASVKPTVSPIHFTTRIKGRLQHHLRRDAEPVKFSRKLSMRTLGENDLQSVEDYVANQVNRADFADPRFAEYLKQFTLIDDSVDLAAPFKVAHGQYWYLLHLVFVVAGRERILDEDWLRTLRDGCFRIARARGHRISRASVMHDHLHLALAGHIDQSPEAIALCYMNNLSYFVDMDALWQPSYYVGTFGSYNLSRVRYLLAGSRLSRALTLIHYRASPAGSSTFGATRLPRAPCA